MNFLDFFLIKREQSSWHRRWGSWQQLDGVIPDGMFRESLGLFLAEDFAMFRVFLWDFCIVCFLSGSYRCFTE